MTNLLGQAINCDDGDAAAKLMQDALGVENNNVVNYCFPKIWLLTESSAPISSAGCKRRRVIWSKFPKATRPSTIVCRCAKGD